MLIRLLVNWLILAIALGVAGAVVPAVEVKGGFLDPHVGGPAVRARQRPSRPDPALPLAAADRGHARPLRHRRQRRPAGDHGGASTLPSSRWTIATRSRPTSPPRSSARGCQVETLAQTANELQIVLPDAVGSALRDGLREEAAPISRRLAEVKGLSNQMVRRMERLETDLLAERHARIDDLQLLVDLITGQWRAMNERLDRIERMLERAAAHERRLDPAGLGRGRPLDRYSAGSTSSKREPLPDLGLEVDPSAERAPRAPSRSRARGRCRPPPRRTARKSRSRSSGAIPGPVSSTATRICPFDRASSRLIRPPSGVARNAFESRLSTIWSTRSPSETITGRALTSTR